MNRYLWAAKEFQWLGRRILHAVTGSYFVNRDKYAGVGIASHSRTNEFIYNGIKSGKPFAAGRMGFAENGFLCCAQNEIYYNSSIHYHWTPSYIVGLHEFTSGKADGGLRRYYDIVTDALAELDAIGTFPDMFMGDAVMANVPNIAEKLLFDVDALDTLHEHVNPFWTKALYQKKVLVVSPFYKEIMAQYPKRNLLWPDGRLPSFELDYDPSIWVDDHPGDYFDALECITERVLKKDFEVAILGCGELGLPLAASIKRSGRSAIQLGSVIHILFGLKGKRFDDKGIYNEYWIRPGEDTKPTYSDTIDDNTYW